MTQPNIEIDSPNKNHNWQNYEQSLVNPSKLTIWLSEDVIESWSSNSKQQMDIPKLYSNQSMKRECSPGKEHQVPPVKVGRLHEG